MPILEKQERDAIDATSSLVVTEPSKKRKREDGADKKPKKERRIKGQKKGQRAAKQRALRDQWLGLFSIGELWDNVVSYAGYEMPVALDLALVCTDFYEYFTEHFIAPYVEKFLLYYTDPNVYSVASHKYDHDKKTAIGVPRTEFQIMEYWNKPMKTRPTNPKDTDRQQEPSIVPSLRNKEYGIDIKAVENVAKLHRCAPYFKRLEVRKKIISLLCKTRRSLIHHAFRLERDSALLQSKFTLFYGDMRESTSDQYKRKYVYLSAYEKKALRKLKGNLQASRTYEGLRLVSSKWRFSNSLFFQLKELRGLIKEKKVTRWNLTDLFHMACHMAVRTTTKPGEAADLTMRLYSDAEGGTVESKRGAQLMEMHWKMSIARKDPDLCEDNLTYVQKQENRIVDYCVMVCCDQKEPIFASTFEYDEQTGTDHAPFYVRAGSEDKIFANKKMMTILDKLEKAPAKTFLEYAQTVRVCSDCGRDLTDTKSQQEGVGPVCRQRITNSVGEYFYECCNNVHPVHQKYKK